MTEEEYLAAYDPRAFPAVAVTVDVVALTIRDGALHVLLVRRGGPPFEGAWALPGGFVQPDEDLRAAAARELLEETGVTTLGRFHLEQLASYGAPDRDPRMRVVSVAHLAFAPDLPDPAAGSDAREAAWVPVDALGLPDAAGSRDRPVRQRPGTSRRLAFDHARILADGLERARGKLEYTPLATRFTGPEFTIAELRAVYEAVWGDSLHAGNFHRKVLSVPGFVESTGATTERGGTRGGPRSKLYRAGDARLLHPALLRPSREEAVR
ncbi:NUDIX hydrolase [Virgisporangium aliadipatigenens]|uniref:NUDIX hydrolase n=1 Tax=Virgisporangium aliadipatigenens TaxID=741659 RepID=A0A8J4DQ08_9ACTN|nr:NUDIX domain-containing protein [Virgisporangium aliadipatigenens]GIJ45461.1 NUDIX hydrolase [Virgisporangium aliadipatigenens]